MIRRFLAAIWAWLLPETTVCSWCYGTVGQPVRDPEAVSWLGDGARTWCSWRCQAAQVDFEINAEGERS